MDVIGQGPERDPMPARKPSRRLTWAAVAVLVVLAAAFAVTRGHRGAAPPWAVGVTASPGARAVPGVPSSRPLPPIMAVPSVSAVRGAYGSSLVLTVPFSAQGAVCGQVIAAPDTALLTCDSAIWAQPELDWRSGSLRVGPLWLIGGRRLGYARLGRADQALQGAGTSAAHRGPGRDVEMLVHVDSGPIVVMRAAPGTTPYFEFLNSPASTGDYQGLDGGRGYTFVPCPAGESAPGGGTDFYDVGFSIVPGHTASVEVWTAKSARPVWITFTAPAGN